MLDPVGDVDLQFLDRLAQFLDLLVQLFLLPALLGCRELRLKAREFVDSGREPGAGDLYASGFLYGLATDRPVEECGRIGALVSGNVVEVVGTRIPDERWTRILKTL